MDVMHKGGKKAKKKGPSAKQCKKKCKRGGFLTSRGRKMKKRCCRKGMTK